MRVLPGRTMAALRRTIPALIRRLRVDSLLRNSLFIMVATVIQSVLGFIFWLIATHTRSAQEVGLAAALISAVTLASVVSSSGINSALIQLLPTRARGQAQSLTLCAGLAAAIGMGVLAALVCALILPLFSHQFIILRHDTAYTMAFLLGVPLFSTVLLLDSTCLAERAAGINLARTAMANTAKNIFLVGLLPFASLGALSIFGASILANASGVVWGIILLGRLGRHYRPVVRGIVKQAKTMVTATLGHHLINLGGVIPQSVLPPLVTIRLSAADNAYFYTTWMTCSIFMIVSPSVASSLFAEGSNTATGMRERTKSSVRIIGILLLPIMLVFLLGDRQILTMFGTEYARNGQWLLVAMVFSAVPDAITNIYVATLRVRCRLMEAALLNLGMAGLAIALSWLLLPLLGITAVGLSWLLAQTTGSLVVWVRIKWG